MVDDADAGLEDLLAHLRDVRGVDFTGYKRPSLQRLLQRRIDAAGCTGCTQYLDLLQAEPGELTRLLDTLLVNVTSFFRDGVPWLVLQEELLPEALAHLGPDDPIRVWSAACATGEEAYTLAMLLHELLGDEAFLRRVKIYATDLDESALATARAGRYPVKAVAGLTTSQLETYFETDGPDRVRFRPDLRRNIIFGRHDLLRDAPISRVLLLSCRNALMYFQAETQRTVIERFRYALPEHGLLLLGRAETLLTQSHLFTPVDLSQRIFRPRRPAPVARLAVGTTGRDALDRAAVAAFVGDATARVVLDATGALSLVNDAAVARLGVRHDHLGRPFQDLELSYRPWELRGPVAAVGASSEPTTMRDLEWPGAEGPTWWDIRISPLLADGDVLGVQLTFDDTSERHELHARLEQSHDELSTAYDELQSSSEELETVNEELQSAIEELETTNEELQSTNEELETMNEELHSSNEELQTVNDELRDRTEEVDRANVSLHGVLEGLDVAVAVTDAMGRVQLWNAAAEGLTGLRAFEIEGLGLNQARTALPADELLTAVSRVVQEVEPRVAVEQAVTDRFGTPQSRRVQISPLRDRSTAIIGAVVTIVDVPVA